MADEGAAARAERWPRGGYIYAFGGGTRAGGTFAGDLNEALKLR